MSKAWFSSCMFGSGNVRREDLFELMMRHRPLDKGDGSKERHAYIEWLGIYHAMRELPSADRPQREWIIHYRDKWMVKAECPKCHRRFEFSPRAIWKCCPMCETRMKGADYETAND